MSLILPILSFVSFLVGACIRQKKILTYLAVFLALPIGNYAIAHNHMAISTSRISAILNSLFNSSNSLKPNSILFFDGKGFKIQTAGHDWSLRAPDDHTLRFEMRPGDHAWFDNGEVDRSQIADGDLLKPNVPTSISYNFMLEPGAANTATWFVTAQMHNADFEIGADVHTSPPVAIELNGEHLRVVARYCPTDKDPTNAAKNLTLLTLWTDPNTIQRGRYYNIKIQSNVNNVNAGYLKVWVDQTQVVDYHGPLGYGAATYWILGLYRSADAPQTVAAYYRNVTITTGFSKPSVSPQQAQ